MSIARNGLMLATLFAGPLVASPALAGSRDDARVAIAAAEAKIETGDKAGVNGPAADTQARARAALDEARRELDHHNENRAIAAAKRASSLADLAFATADQRVADAERANAAAQPQE